MVNDVGTIVCDCEICSHENFIIGIRRNLSSSGYLSSLTVFSVYYSIRTL